MAEILIENAVKHFGKFTAIDNISLTIHDRASLTLRESGLRTGSGGPW